MAKPLTREVSLGVGLGTAAIVYAIYDGHLPSIADARNATPGDPTLKASNKQATWIAAGFVAGVSFLAKDPTVLVIGGVTLLALCWSHKHAANYNPATQGVDPMPTSRRTDTGDGLVAGYTPAG